MKSRRYKENPKLRERNEKIWAFRHTNHLSLRQIEKLTGLTNGRVAQIIKQVNEEKNSTEKSNT